MNHQYSRFKKKNIPYAKVGRRVFINLFNAETFCSKHGLDMDSAIEYGENTELKRKVEEIAKYQKPIIREEDEQQKRLNTLIFVLKYIIRLAGFELLNRVELKDKKTGKEFK